jgi:hypothetical protein
MTPIKLDLESLDVTTFETGDGASYSLAAGQQAAQPGCSDCFSSCNLLFTLVGF